ncbi:MAG TPA: iron-sulfur cluster assembly protein [Ktedonobacteraceae bacterium]|nr:iron-sulfur cluster assembly protein [Ktedonobacteraceae bacterium]
MSSTDSPFPVASAFDVTEAGVYAAIADVLDPELDEPLVKLGFIDSVQINGPDVTVVFKLPTYWCSPNFAYLMASDLRARLRAIPGVRAARVVLLDHCAEDEVTNGVNMGQSFAEAFAGEVTEDENLEELRYTFLRKGFLMRQDTLLRQMLKAGLDETMILSLQRGDLIADEAADIAFVTTPTKVVRLERAGRNAGTYLRKGVALGLAHHEHDLLITDDQGQPVAPGSLQQYLRHSRSIRLNIMFNTSICTGLFRTRYASAGVDEAYREGENL